MSLGFNGTDRLESNLRERRGFPACFTLPWHIKYYPKNPPAQRRITPQNCPESSEIQPVFLPYWNLKFFEKHREEPERLQFWAEPGMVNLF